MTGGTEGGKNRIYLSPPDVGEAEREALLRAFDSGWIAPLGPEVDAFELELADFCGRQHAVALSSGTAALHLALLTAGVRPADRVLVSDLTFIATANAVLYTGAEPVFIDSESASWNMDPNLLEDKLKASSRVGRPPAAVMPVDLFGQCADYATLTRICHEYEVPLIEDAAEALGASFQGTPAGSFGKAAALSFNGNKIMTTSGGGALLTDDVETAERVKYLATQAREPVAHYEHVEVGFNYRLSNLLAAVGRAQLVGLPNRVERRREIREQYRAALEAIPGVDLMPESADGRSNAWLTVITVDPQTAPFTAEQLRAALSDENIESRPIWKPMHLQPVFAQSEVVGGQVSERLFNQGTCLPSGSGLSDEQQAHVIRQIRSLAT